MRYRVTEISGYMLSARGTNSRIGTSFHVIDTLWNHRVVRTHRTEDYGPLRAGREERARAAAEADAARLNRLHARI